jgi:hypothetical protein
MASTKVQKIMTQPIVRAAQVPMRRRVRCAWLPSTSNPADAGAGAWPQLLSPELLSASAVCLPAALAVPACSCLTVCFFCCSSLSLLGGLSPCRLSWMLSCSTPYRLHTGAEPDLQVFAKCESTSPPNSSPALEHRIRKSARLTARRPLLLALAENPHPGVALREH